MARSHAPRKKAPAPARFPIAQRAPVPTTLHPIWNERGECSTNRHDRIEARSYTGTVRPRLHLCLTPAAPIVLQAVTRESERLRAGPCPDDESVFRRCGNLRHLSLFSVSVPVLAAIHLSEQTANLDHRIGTSSHGDALIDFTHLRSRLGELARSGRGDRGAQLVEFAVSLPLLVLFVVGIFDFSNAFTLKQKLTNITRDAARVSAGEPASDLQSPSTSAPASVMDAFQDVDNYLVANNINDCGIVLSRAPVGLTWTSFAGETGVLPGD